MPIVDPKRSSFLALTLAAAALLGACGGSDDANQGLNAGASQELKDRGLAKYQGQFRPAQSVAQSGTAWTKHTFDTQSGAGPICIDGSAYTAFTRPKDASKLLIFLNGGGACWQNFYNCSTTASSSAPPDTGALAASGTGPDGTTVANPMADYSVVWASYCDGSVYTGDKTLTDASFPGGTRHHRGLRNLTAVMDLAKAQFPNATKVVVAGSSAGGLGAAVWAPFLARLEYGNGVDLSVFDDSGPIWFNLAAQGSDGSYDNQRRAADWAFGQFFPASCTDCNELGDFTSIVRWRLRNDSTIREALYATDADATLRFFLRVPTQAAFRELLLAQTATVAGQTPDRYRRYVVSGTAAHTEMQSGLYFGTRVNGISLVQWTQDFLNGGPSWVENVQSLVAVP